MALSNLGLVAEKVWMVIGIFMPLIVGGIVAFVLNVPMHFFEVQMENLAKRTGKDVFLKGKGPLALVITLVAFILVLGFVGMVIFPNLVESVKTLAGGVMENIPAWLAWLEQHGIDTTTINQWVGAIQLDSLLEKLRSNIGNILSSAGAAAGSIAGVLSNVAFGLIFAVYILLSKQKLGQQAKQMAYAFLKEDWADEVCDIASLSYKTFAGFLSGQCLEAVILGSLFCIVLGIAGFPYAITIGVIIGFMSLIPFVGAFIGLAFGLLLLAVEAPGKLLLFVIIFFVVQQIEGNLIYPKVVGNSVGLPALWTLLAVVVGGSVSGIFGIIVFIPLFSVIYALIRRSVYTRLEKKGMRI